MIGNDYYDRLAKVESGGDPLAKNPKSSAKGRYQFINSTAKQYGLDKYDFGTPEYTQAEDQAVRKLTQDNYDFLKTKLNREPTHGELYLAHQQGAGGAEAILTADPTQKAIDALGVDQVLNNGGNEDITLGEFQKKWTSKFGDNNGQNDGQVRIADSGGMGQTAVIDAFSDFGIGEGNGDIDALADFKVDVGDKFLSQDDGLGGLKKSMIDQSRGAPAFIRQVVGGFIDPPSRLATLQKYYPDAKPFGKDNFVYTDPETRKPTLYNPEGFDKGDFASISKEVFVSGGGSIGAVMGGAAGLAGGPAAPVTSPYGAIVGAGLGAGAASNLWDLWATVTGQTSDVRGLPQRATETSVEVFGSALGEGIGRELPGALKSAIGGAKASSRAVLAQLARFNIRPTATITQGAVAGRIEGALAQNIGAADIIAKQTDEVIEQTHTALNKIIGQYGKPKTEQGAGRVIQQAAESAATRLETKSGDLYDVAYDLVGADTPSSLVNISTLKKELLSDLSQAPETKKRVLAPALERVNAILADAKANNGISFETLRSIRTDIGKDLKEPLSSGATASQNIAMRRVYAAMSEDMNETAKMVSDASFEAVKRADKYKKAYETTATEMLNKIQKYDAEEKAYKFALSASKDGGSSLQKLRKLFTPNEWDEVSATVLSELGNNPASGEFSIAKFVTSYNKLAPEAKSALFKGGKNQAAGESLDDFVDLLSKLKETARYENTSNTAGAIQTTMVLNSLGVAGAGLLAGDFIGVGQLGGMALSTGGARMSAMLITSPSFVKWLAQPVKEGTKDWTAHLARLVVIGQANPEIKDAVNSLLLDLQKQTAPEKTE